MPPRNEAPIVSSRRTAQQRRGAAATETTAHWKTGGATTRADARRGRSSLRRYMGLFLLGLLFLGSAASLVYYLILSPAKTPMVAAIALDYRWPLPPNAWTREDVDGLTDALGSETVSIAEVALQGPSSLEELTRQLAAASGRVRAGGTVMVYVSAHAAVDGAGEPCLLLPESDPLDSATWFRLRDLLTELKSVQQRYACRHLLILDTHRQHTNWSIGLLDDFSQRIEATVRQAAVPNLVVLNSASSGQVGWTSLPLQGSAFGYWLRYGLAGEADANGDGQVSCRELVAYLQRHVDGWAQTHRASRQVPLLIPPDAPDFPLTWSLNPRALRRLRRADDSPGGESGSLSGDRIAWLWNRHDELATLLPGHYAPHRWHQIQHDLLWLEQASLAGRGYREVVERMSSRLEGDVTSLLEQVRELDASAIASPIRLTAALTGDRSLANTEMAAGAPPLAEYLGLPTGAARDAGGSPLSQLLTRHRSAQLSPDDQLIEQVLDLHEYAAKLAVPRELQDAAADSRAHRVIRPLLEPLDQARRMIEDRLFEDDASTTDLARQMLEVQQQYQQLDDRQATLARGYQVRDRVWSALPYLAAWSCRPSNRNLSTTADLDSASEPLELDAPQLVDSLSSVTHQLDRVLQQVERDTGRDEDSSDALAAIDTLATNASGQLDALLGLLADQARRVALPGPASPQLLNELDGLLATPLVPAELRATLYEQYLTAVGQVDRAATLLADNATAAVTMENTPVLSTELVDLPEQGTCPPARLAAALLSGDDERWLVQAERDLPAFGETLRRALRHAAPSSADLPADDLPTDVGSQQPREDSASAVTGVSTDPWQQDRRLRRLVALAGSGVRDPYQPLRRRALQELLLWHARQAVDDFWAVIDPDGRPYFVTVAQTHLDNTVRLGSPAPPIAREIQRLGDLFERRKQAARTGLQTLSTDLLLIDDHSDLTAQIGIRATPQTPDLPTGLATVQLRDQLGFLPGTIRAIPLPPGQQPGVADEQTVAITLTGQDLSGRGPGMQAVLQFRGHEFATPLRLHHLHGPRIELTRYRYGPSRITLAGTEPRTASIVFILDCSQSMRDRIDVEAPEIAGTPASFTKMQVAIDALRELLERFGERGDARIGVRFFGHRVGWRTDQPDTLARREDYPDPIPPTLPPYADVELALPLGRFDSVTAGTVVRRLEALRPWGETPLYLSLRQALQDFGPLDAQTDRRVVVITDGINYQFNPSPEFAPSRAEIEQAYTEQGVQIDILGFGIPDDEQATAVREFTALADSTGGTFTVATNASSLIRGLQQQLSKTTFRVLDGETVLGQAELGGTVRLDPVRESVIEVGQVREPVQLEGSEHLQLRLSRTRQRVLSLPYDEGSPRFAPLIAPGSAAGTNYRVGLHRTIRSSQAVIFPISFQTADETIPVRPGHVWIEITPIGRDRNAVAESYVFFDANYEPNLPVPVMHCRCSDWPAEATQAELRVWCLPQPIESAEVIPLTAVADRLPPTENGFPVKRTNGVYYQVRQIAPNATGDPLRIRVVQRHESGIPIHALKLDLAPPARHVVRRFDAQQGVVLHDFEFDANASPPADSITLRWQTRDELTAPAWQLERPVSLGIRQQDEVVLPPQILDFGEPTMR
ncbi:MAG: VWA domain-containing protein [Planctomycetaceae bacterium]|nr:MAG: VWA domain-containing protein [Planctomycetaceae bacterium]